MPYGQDVPYQSEMCLVKMFAMYWNLFWGEVERLQVFLDALGRFFCDLMIVLAHSPLQPMCLVAGITFHPMRQATAGGSSNPGVHTLVQERAGAFPIEMIKRYKKNRCRFDRLHWLHSDSGHHQFSSPFFSFSLQKPSCSTAVGPCWNSEVNPCSMFNMSSPQSRCTCRTQGHGIPCGGQAMLENGSNMYDSV